MNTTRNRIKELLQEAKVHEEDIIIPERGDEDDGTPASSRQTWALMSITGKDFRSKGLTAKQASWMIDDLNKKSGYVRGSAPPASDKPARMTSKPKPPKFDIRGQLEDYIIDNIDKLVEVLQNEMGIVSGINDGITGKRTPYKFYGGGMGFAWIEFDKRSKKAKEIVEMSGGLRDFINKEVIRRGFTQKQREELPLVPMTVQNMVYHITYYQIVSDFMRELGIRSYVRSRLD